VPHTSTGLDSYHDRRTAYSFGVTAAGVRVDYFHSTDDQSNRDYSFDPVERIQDQDPIAMSAFARPQICGVQKPNRGASEAQPIRRLD
jgi:hypothetical protein